MAPEIAPFPGNELFGGSVAFVGGGGDAIICTMRAPRAIATALVVDDDAALAENLAEIVQEYAVEVATAGSVAEARQRIESCPPEIVLLDFSLPDGTGLEVLTLLESLERIPTIVAISGEAGPSDGFALARRGVRSFLPKPSTLVQVRAAIEQALAATPSPLREVRASVGRVSIEEVEEGVRRAMVSEAIARSQGSIRAAAALLGISRQRLQYILRTLKGH